MKDFGKTLGEIYEEHRGLIFWMVGMILVLLGFLIYGLVTLKPSAALVKIGYGDIGGYHGGEWSEMQTQGGYRDGGWTEMLAWPTVALVMIITHIFIALKIYQKKGAAVAEMFLFITMMVVIFAWVVLSRLVGEG